MGPSTCGKIKRAIWLFFYFNLSSGTVFFLSFCFVFCPISVYATANNGINTSIPKTPNVLPPSVTATRTHIEGKRTEWPTTRGYTRFASNCCKAKNTTINQNACMGFTIRMKNAPENTSDKGAKNGNQCRKRHQYADEHRIWKSQQPQRNDKHAAKDQGLHTLT